MKTHPTPAGYHTATPYLIVKGAAKAIAFYREAFGASERMRLDGPGGVVMHAEIQIGDSPIMLADEFPQMNALGTLSLGGSSVLILLYVEDGDALFQRAVNAGAISERPLQNQFYGDRSGTLRDPFGHRWTVATRVEEVSPEELRRRMMTMGGK